MALSPDDWCTRKEAAAYLHVSVQTITRYCLAGRLTWRRIEGSRGYPHKSRFGAPDVGLGLCILILL